MGSDPTSHGRANVITLDADGLDLLELVLNGAIPLSVLEERLGAALDPHTAYRFQDGENTPLAEVSNGSIAPLQPLARGIGPQWNPALRIGPADLRRLVSGIDRGGAVALAVHAPPSTRDLERTLAAARETNAPAVLVVGLVSRNAGPADSVTRRVGPAGIARSVSAAATTLQDAAPELRVHPLVVPVPLMIGAMATHREALVRQALLAYGVADIVFGEEFGATGDPEYLALLPPGSREEYVRLTARVPIEPTVLFFTGLSGSGKSTIARAVAEQLADGGTDNVVLLDGDEMRRRISQDLGFDRASRNTNVERIATTASTIASDGGIAIAAPIAPFAEGRARAREIASSTARFLLVYVSTPLAVCESRDRKGLYARARAGEVHEFTGISSPYDVPTDADLEIDASVVPIERAVDQVMTLLSNRAS